MSEPADLNPEPPEPGVEPPSASSWTGRGPERLGSYQLLELIGSGGMAEVYLARADDAPEDAPPVALKRLRPELLDDETVRAMFSEEARLALLLHHPGIVRALESGEDEGVPYLVMEHVRGGNLERAFAWHRRAGRRIAPEVVAHILAEVAGALAFAHRATDDEGTPLGLVHRDVTPQNILLSRGGDVKLCDFGIARADGRTHRTQAGILKGKVAYMSPEQVAQRPLDHRTDQFSLGVVLHELLVGQRLFHTASEYETLDAVRRAEVEPPSRIVPELGQAWDEVVARMLDRAPGARYPDMEAVQSALRNLAPEDGRAALVEHLFTPKARTPLPDRPATVPGAQPAAEPEGSALVEVSAELVSPMSDEDTFEGSEPLPGSLEPSSEVGFDDEDATLAQDAPFISEGSPLLLDHAPGADEGFDDPTRADEAPSFAAEAEITAGPVEGELSAMLGEDDTEEQPELLERVPSRARAPSAAPEPAREVSARIRPGPGPWAAIVAGVGLGGAGALAVIAMSTGNEATLRVEAEPAGAMTVIVDGAVVAGETPAEVTPIEPGVHEVELRAEGFERWAQTVHIGSKRSRTLEAELRPLDR